MAVDEPNMLVGNDINGKGKAPAESKSQVSAVASSQLQRSAPADEGSDTAPDSDVELVPSRKTAVPATSTPLPVSATDSPPAKTKPAAPRRTVAPDESSSESDAKPQSKPTKASSMRRTGDASSSDSSPPPAKKVKPTPAQTAAAIDDSSSDSDDDRRLAGVRRGTRQPIKRGGRRC